MQNLQPMLLCAMVLMASRSGAQDAAVDAGAPFTLFEDYKCLPAPPMVHADGGWLASPERKARIDCGLAGAQAELDLLRPPAKADQGFKLLPSHGIISAVVALATSYLAIVKSRTDRGCRGVANPFGPC